MKLQFTDSQMLIKGLSALSEIVFDHFSFLIMKNIDCIKF